MGNLDPKVNTEGSRRTLPQTVPLLQPFLMPVQTDSLPSSGQSYCPATPTGRRVTSGNASVFHGQGLLKLSKLTVTIAQKTGLSTAGLTSVVPVRLYSAMPILGDAKGEYQTRCSRPSIGGFAWTTCCGACPLYFLPRLACS